MLQTLALLNHKFLNRVLHWAGVPVPCSCVQTGAPPHGSSPVRSSGSPHALLKGCRFQLQPCKEVVQRPGYVCCRLLPPQMLLPHAHNKHFFSWKLTPCCDSPLMCQSMNVHTQRDYVRMLIAAAQPFLWTAFIMISGGKRKLQKKSPIQSSGHRMHHGS